MSKDKKFESKACKKNMFECAYPAPYPEIRVVRQNPYYGRILLEDYAGEVSELSAIAQYLYHHIVLEPEFEEVADLLECISLVEMHHQEMLAKTILMLGVDPRYFTLGINDEPQYWNATYVYYGTSLCDRLTADIASEWAAIANYREHQQMIDDPYVKDILGRIILDELHHIELFNTMVQKYCRPCMSRK